MEKNKWTVIKLFSFFAWQEVVIEQESLCCGNEIHPQFVCDPSELISKMLVRFTGCHSQYHSCQDEKTHRGKCVLMRGEKSFKSIFKMNQGLGCTAEENFYWREVDYILDMLYLSYFICLILTVAQYWNCWCQTVNIWLYQCLFRAAVCYAVCQRIENWILHTQAE